VTQQIKILIRYADMTITRTLAILILLSFVLLATSCVREPRDLPDSADGLRPIYIQVDTDLIRSEDPRPFGILGKIVLQAPYIFINELSQGIHILDNSDPFNPVAIAFFNIPGNIDFTVNGNILFADNSYDLYVINIEDIHNIKLSSIVENVYEQNRLELAFPPEYDGYFECVDTTRGLVVGWEQALLEFPKCWTF